MSDNPSPRVAFYGTLAAYASGLAGAAIVVLSAFLPSYDPADRSALLLVAFVLPLALAVSISLNVLKRFEHEHEGLVRGVAFVAFTLSAVMLQAGVWQLLAHRDEILGCVFGAGVVVSIAICVFAHKGIKLR